jgi:hypothetical protein
VETSKRKFWKKEKKEKVEEKLTADRLVKQSALIIGIADDQMILA